MVVAAAVELVMLLWLMTKGLEMGLTSQNRSDTWLRSRLCQFQTCVEVKRTPGAVLIRDSKEVELGDDYTILSVSPLEWVAFLDLIKVSPSKGQTKVLAYDTVEGGDVILVDGEGQSLRYDAGEWTAFCGGVHDGDFDLKFAGAST